MYQWMLSCATLSSEGLEARWDGFQCTCAYWLDALHDTHYVVLSLCTKCLFITVMRFVVVVHLFFHSLTRTYCFYDLICYLYVACVCIVNMEKKRYVSEVIGLHAANECH